MSILVLNAGSSSIKAAVFDSRLERGLIGAVTGIGGKAMLVAGGAAAPCDATGHAAALASLLDAFAGQGLAIDHLEAAAHRVVHGGLSLVQPCRVTPEIREQIRAYIPLAPLHNPHNLAAIEALARIAPDLPQFASFDTAFHSTNPEVARSYAIPADETAKGIRRYGFHGISYASLATRLPQMTGTKLPPRVLALHLGNGASLCAIRDGRSVATTMGYSPLEGLTMGTRAGGIDANAVLRLAREHGIDATTDLLNNKSGLLALGGHSDMRALRAAGTLEAAFAIAHFAYWVARHSGSMIAAMGGIDAVVFTGGIGENDAEMRRDILDHLSWLGLKLDPEANAAHAMAVHGAGSALPVWIFPAEEERAIAADALAVMAREAAP